MWEFMHQQHIKLDDQTPTIPLLRVNDIPIMEAVMSSNLFSAEEIKIINKCRLSIKVISLADMTSCNGCLITIEAWNGRMNAWYRDVTQ